MSRIRVSVSMTILGTLAICGCVVGRKEFDLANIHNYALPTSDIANNQKVIIDAVIDKRKFSTRRDSSPAVPAAGYGVFWSNLEDTPEIRKCLIGRLTCSSPERSAGDMITKDHYTVENHFRKLIRESLQRAGFVVRTSDDGAAWHVNVDINQFWTSPKYSHGVQTRTELTVRIAGNNVDETVFHDSRSVIPLNMGDYGKVLEQNADEVVRDLALKFARLRSQPKRMVESGQE